MINFEVGVLNHSDSSKGHISILYNIITEQTCQLLIGLKMSQGKYFRQKNKNQKVKQNMDGSLCHHPHLKLKKNILKLFHRCYMAPYKLAGMNLKKKNPALFVGLAVKKRKLISTCNDHVPISFPPVLRSFWRLEKL